MTCPWRKNNIAIYGNAKKMTFQMTFHITEMKAGKQNQIINIAFNRFRYFQNLQYCMILEYEDNFLKHYADRDHKLTPRYRNFQRNFFYFC